MTSPKNVIQLNRLSKKTLVINSKSVFNAKKLPRHPEQQFRMSRYYLLQGMQISVWLRSAGSLFHPLTV